MKSLSILKDNSGAALMMAIFTMTMLLAISMDMLFETSVEVQVSSQAVNQVKAYYAAKAGVEISLLRLHIYRKALIAAGSMLPNKSMLDPIWQTPFMWPPVVPPGTTGVDQSEIKKVVKESLMKSTYYATIESEGSKIDINDLGSDNKMLAAAAQNQLLQIFTNKIETDEKFANKYRGVDFQKILNNIADWTDSDTVSRNGGDESAVYPDANGSKLIPPNRPFKTMQELHLVEGVTDEIYNLLQSQITIYGTSGINVNYAPKEVLMALSPVIKIEQAQAIVDARNDPNRGPFKDLPDFMSFLKDKFGFTDQIFKNKDGTEAVPLIFDAEYNFRIKSTGTSGKVSKDITAIVYDLDQAKARLAALAPTPTPTPSPVPGQNPNAPLQTPQATATPAAANTKSPTERPNIVYWNET